MRELISAAGWQVGAVFLGLILIALFARRPKMCARIFARICSNCLLGIIGIFILNIFGLPMPLNEISAAAAAVLGFPGVITLGVMVLI
ncbi:MAG: pro-sigmaK processing inhibitor BofA family protein [Firmicutes bacterium]|nr:pro-sigmaK processing inhibitor BofA family protein [Bacillota bacterium]